jgi:hypothetical protein
MNANGVKTLKSYSKPYNLKNFNSDWLTAEEDIWEIDGVLNSLPHYSLVPQKNRRFIRNADAMELKAGRIEEWPEKKRRVY